ncbi:hypothetical protein SLEP1_g15429 [Rubroshorea leprosula]|uniref:Glycosyl transferase CAP10 domain-containing protein n=1 Tax=Rubroshorea leprosula TaxID=152421 RepID=A0AAV5IMA6_9ROSI|nr:hypothetical protein SLEP1_g15429 [Rubroshorea leprosula]
MCPSYFRWIHEDLRPWRDTGVTKDMVELARKSANFRLVIVNGKANLQKYMGCYETRDVFSLWGILQFLRWHPGRLPDLDMMFECGDLPVIPCWNFQGPKACPPPLFLYCSPSWISAEVNIRPWTNMLKDIKEGTKRINWKDRVPYAHWKGNQYVGRARGDLMECTVTNKKDWNACLYIMHYWPIKDDTKCASLKFSVEWGNTHPDKVEFIQKATVKLFEKELNIDVGFDYMFHLLNKYAKLPKFRPEVPEGAVELCPEGMACPETRRWRKFMEKSLVTSPSDTVPCTLPPSYSVTVMREFLERKTNATKQMEMWETEYWSAILNSLRLFWGLFLIVGVTGPLALVYFDPGISVWKRILQIWRNFDQKELTSHTFRQHELKDNEDRNIEIIPINGASEAPAEDPNEVSDAAASAAEPGL